MSWTEDDSCALGAISDGLPDLRDRYAMAALTGFVSLQQEHFFNSDICRQVAARCYEIADAMLVARKPKQESD